MPIAWPATLPDKLLQDGFREVLPKNTIRQEMDVGPPKARRRGTAAPRLISGRMIFTAAQKTTHDTFYTTTTKDGSLSFEWTNPGWVSGTMTLMYASEPVYTPNEDSSGNLRYIVDLEFQVWS